MENKLEKQIAIDKIVEQLVEIENSKETKIEYEIAKPKLIRELYKVVGEPTQELFPEEFNVAGGCWKKHSGYTTFINIFEGDKLLKKDFIRKNNDNVEYRIKRPSQRKLDIAKDYMKNSWSVEYQAFNVICTKIVQHPLYKDILVNFYSSRDCNKYSLIVFKEN